MRYRLNQFCTLAGLTTLECIRQPISLILLGSCMIFMTLLPVLLTQTLGEADKLVRDSCLALHFLFGLLMGSLAASSTLSREIQHGTAASVLAKPVGRELFFLAKFTGVALLVLLFCAAATLATLLSTRMVGQPWQLDLVAGAVCPLALLIGCTAAGVMNYYVRRPFVSNAFGITLSALVVLFAWVNHLDAEGAATIAGSLTPWALLPASVLVTLATVVLAACSISLATRFGTVATLSICTVVFLLGLMSDYLFGRLAADHLWAGICYASLPNWQHFWAADALSHDMAIPVRYVAETARYAGLYLVGILGFGIASFRHREIST